MLRIPGIFISVIGLSACASIGPEMRGHELRKLLVGKTEIGTIVRPSFQDFGEEGDTYEIKYLADGTLEYRDGSKRLKGFYSIHHRAICRAPERRHVRIRCRTIHRDGEGFVAKGASSGLTRYEFKLRSAAKLTYINFALNIARAAQDAATSKELGNL